MAAIAANCQAVASVCTLRVEVTLANNAIRPYWRRTYATGNQEPVCPPPGIEPGDFKVKSTNNIATMRGQMKSADTVIPRLTYWRIGNNIQLTIVTLAVCHMHICYRYYSIKRGELIQVGQKFIKS